jgi:hypothetical protein
MATGVLELASDVHDRLLKLVAPASPRSIEASSFSPRRNPTLFGMCVVAVFSFICFIIPVVISVYGGADTWKELYDLLRIIGGAGLGSSFYALRTASSYIETNTFEPRYNRTYIVRLGLGMLAGLILAYFLKDFLTVGGSQNGSTSNGPTLQNISVSALALLGGYASEGVARILDRASDTLITIISGSDKDKVDAARQKADADAQTKTTQALSDAASKLHDAASNPDPADAIKAVRKIAGDLLGKK